MAINHQSLAKQPFFRY